MTSQRGTVTTIDPRTKSLSITFDDTDAPVVLRGEQLDEHHLDHAYATTVHRAQGATVDRAHVYLDGGGRELTYVALTRATDQTTIHCVADSLSQAVEDLQRDWSHDRRQRWTLDTDLPATPGQRTRPALMPGVDVGLRLGRLRAEREAILAAMPADPRSELAALHNQRLELEQHLEELQTGTGRCHGTETGQADAAFREIEARAKAAQRAAKSPALSRRQQRKYTRLADDLRADLEAARQRWERIVRPVEQHLTAQIDTLDQQAERLGFTRHQRDFWRLEHPNVINRLAALNREIARLEHHAGVPTVDRDALRRQPNGIFSG